MGKTFSHCQDPNITRPRTEHNPKKKELLELHGTSSPRVPPPLFVPPQAAPTRWVSRLGMATSRGHGGRRRVAFAKQIFGSRAGSRAGSQLVQLVQWVSQSFLEKKNLKEPPKHFGRRPETSWAVWTSQTWRKPEHVEQVVRRPENATKTRDESPEAAQALRFSGFWRGDDLAGSTKESLRPLRKS